MRILGIALVSAALSAQTIGTRIDKLLSASPVAQQAFWGIRVIDLKTGATVYSKNQNQFFVPASNTKLFSTALALSRLGPGHRFRTTITSPKPPDSSGRVEELRFVGGGDPGLSGRAIPYEYDSPPADPLRYVEQFAQQLADMGLKHVAGDVIGDDSAYAREPYPEGWALDDPIYSYGAPVSALLLNDGMFTLRVVPALIGEGPAIEWTPAVHGMVIHNYAVTGASTKLKYVRLPGDFELAISGTVAEVQEEYLGMENPALFAAAALRDALMKRGVRISGSARVEHSPAPGFSSLITHESPPLIEYLRVINKESQNLYAELMLLEVARVRTGIGSREAGIAELKMFLRAIGISDRQYYFEDASGLSRKTLVTPLTVTKLLEHMYRSPHREAWISTLPVGGEDGTLGKRFSRRPGASAIQAKTGSITHVNALSGYAGRYAFSILVNNSNDPAAPVRRLIDQIALTLVH